MKIMFLTLSLIFCAGTTRAQESLQTFENAPILTHDSTEQSGRAKLLVSSTIMGLAYYGWAIPEIGNFNNERASIGTYMLSSAGSFFIPFLLTKNQPVTQADASLFIHGQTRGIIHGMALAGIVQPHTEKDYFLAYGMAGSILEGTGAYLWSRSQNMSQAQTATISAYSDFGIGFGLALAHANGAMSEINERKTGLYTLGGSIVGITGGALIANSNSYTKGDALMLRASGQLGAFLPFAAMTMIRPKNRKNFSIASMVGGAGGILLGHHLAQKSDFSSSQGTYLNLGELAGALFGGGFGYILANTREKQRNYTMFGSMTGSLATYVLLTQHFIRNHKETSDTRKSGPDFSLFPGFIPGPGAYLPGVPAKPYPGFGALLQF
ncbi:MAG TPA: hypothetical protein DIW47_08345 [Bacteroidetes bacterium]|nr:hypothetical protein [Bacteroidota bacterium]